jgi:hypothetical protein
MLGFWHKDSKAQSGTKGRKKKNVTLSASFFFCVFVAKNTPRRGILQQHTLQITTKKRGLYIQTK